MDRKDVQEQRMKSYFIEAAKSMIKGEGVKSVSVRRVAERAGYSYATLYNYFKNLGDLLFVCVTDFLEECRQFILAADDGKEPGAERIKSLSLSYIRYFIQYPGIFDLLFLEKMSELAHNEKSSMAIYMFLEDLMNDDWQVLQSQKGIPDADLSNMKDTLKMTLNGILLFYLNRRIPGDYKEFIENANARINFVLGLK